MPTSSPTRHAAVRGVMLRAVGGLAAAALVLAGCGGNSSASPSESAASTTGSSAPAATARDLVRQQLGADHELLIVVAEGAAVAAVHRATDQAGPYEALTTYRLEGGQLTGATAYRTTQRPGAGPTTAMFDSTGPADPAKAQANRQLVLTMYHEVIDLRQPDAPARHIAEGYIQHNPMVPQGRAGIEGFIQRLGPAAPGSSTRKEELVIADGDLVLLVSGSGAGRRIADLFRVENGLVAEHWDFIPAA